MVREARRSPRRCSGGIARRPNYWQQRGSIRAICGSPPGWVALISSDESAGPTRDTGKRASENLLNRYGNDIQGVFCVNESSTHGMLLALQDIGKAGAITFVGFDYSASFLEPLRKGELKGFVVQNPVNMGYLSVKTMVAHLKKQPVPATVDTGVEMVTLENLQDPTIQAVINPK